jgi:micrococcal nuclease
VTLVKDVSERDPFDRLLRYVYAGGVFVNAQLVAQGYARAVSFPPDTAHYAEFQALEQAARDAGRGCHALGVFAPQGGAGGGMVASTQPPGADNGGCDPAYPTVCLPPPPPDLDCGDINFRRFDVLPPDPHNFDGDGDRVGCEG